MEDGGFTPTELVYLLVSHTVTPYGTLVSGHEAVLFDTTPFTFDTQFFLKTLFSGVGAPFDVNSTDGAEVNSSLPESNESYLEFAFNKRLVALSANIFINRKAD